MAQSAELLDVFLKHYKSELCVHNSPEASCIWWHEVLSYSPTAQKDKLMKENNNDASATSIQSDEEGTNWT